MTNLKDKDLLSVQEARSLLEQAKEAHRALSLFPQEKLNEIIKAVSYAAIQNELHLAEMAVKETGFGNVQDKRMKNRFAAQTVYEAIKDTPVVGVLRNDTKTKVLDIGMGVGVICGIVPSTNPTSTVIFKTLISLKSGNCIVFSPHPGARECTMEAVKIIATAAENAGCPKGAVSCLSIPTPAGTDALMKHNNTALILATDGPGMVRSAYASGKPAIGVGAGNGPAFIDKSADIKKAVSMIFASKTFDNGTICASEQSIIIEKCIQEKVDTEIKAQGGYILNPQEKERLSKFILRPNGSMNPAIVGKKATEIASLANISVPGSTKVLLAYETKVGFGVPFSQEKLAPVLGFYIEENTDAVLEKAAQILNFEGAGHTFSMHAEDDDLVMRFAFAMPVSRILVNTPAALGGIGKTTNLFPSLTLGCGAVGGSSSSNNIGPLDIINIKRVAYGVRNIENNSCDTQIEQIVKQVLEKLMQ
ncbi:MAG: acetaldehyde dehydrogenase (acetylating) [Clostridia bacterium]|nr:acetaldehyde dehydrogenase (acetylating) [Clostridia bacterium]